MIGDDWKCVLFMFRESSLAGGDNGSIQYVKWVSDIHAMPFSAIEQAKRYADLRIASASEMEAPFTYIIQDFSNLKNSGHVVRKRLTTISDVLFASQNRVVNSVKL